MSQQGNPRWCQGQRKMVSVCPGDTHLPAHHTVTVPWELQPRVRLGVSLGRWDPRAGGEAGVQEAPPVQVQNCMDQAGAGGRARERPGASAGVWAALRPPWDPGCSSAPA